MTNTMQEIPIKLIYVSKTATQNARRKHFRKEELEDLISSIATHGVLQPIIVRPRPTNSGFTHELVAGERRFLAADEAGLQTIPAMVRELTDEQVIEVQLIENLQRKDLHPMQEAEGYQELMKKHGHTVDELHDRVGKSKSYVYGRLKLLALATKVRAAFYDDRISASVALLIARIPSSKLQENALKEMTYDPDATLSHREASRIIRDNYMLRLKDAPFPTGDPDLHRQAGPCNACPKRTGNQPELFGDIESADVCTDPICFGVKRKEHGDRVIKAAKQSGQPVIAGKDLKKVMPYGEGSRHLSGYSRLDAKNYSDARSRTNRAILGKDVEVTLIQMLKTGEVVEIVKDSVVNAALKKSKPAATPATDDGTRARMKKAKLEKQFRAALYAELRTKLQPPPLRLVAQTLYDLIDHELIKTVCQVRGFEPPVHKGYGGLPGGNSKDWRVFEKTIADIPGDELPLLVNDLIFARELQVSTWSDRKPELLLEKAKVYGIDAKALRKSLTKKKAKKKPAKKKAKSKRKAA